MMICLKIQTCHVPVRVARLTGSILWQQVLDSLAGEGQAHESGLREQGEHLAGAA